MLNVSNLRKEFDGIVAVDDISLEVRSDSMFGFLGPNGAGKTTTIRTILNIIKPDRGAITFDGKPFHPDMWNTIGYLPEERGLYRKSKIVHTIQYFASLKGIDEREAKKRALVWLERFGLQDRINAKVEELSRGNQQKIQLIISILHKPRLLILDEPFAGFDPVNQILLKDILLELRKEGVAIIFSTHQMEQAEKLCDDILLINKGKMVVSGQIAEVKKRYGKNSVRLEYDGEGGFLQRLKGVRKSDIYQNYAELELEPRTTTNEIIEQVTPHVQLKKFELLEPSLNSIFIEAVGGIPPSKEATQ
jgi:ABC-2 type transport system ATP-binding protein